MDKEYRLVAHKDDLNNGEIKGISIGHEKICLVKIEEGFYAIEDFCSHAGGVMSTGVLDGVEIICPLHGARFDVRSGKQTLGPSSNNQAIYPVLLEGDSLYLGKIIEEGL